MDSIDVDVEPPVLASMTLANNETVYVELSSEGQHRMREGTIVELSNSDVAAPVRWTPSFGPKSGLAKVEPAGSVLVVVVSCELGCRPGPGTRNGPTPVRGDGVQVAASAPRSGVGAERRTWRRSSTRGPFRTIARRCPATAASTCRPRWRGPCTGAQSRPPTPGLARRQRDLRFERRAVLRTGLLHGIGSSICCWSRLEYHLSCWSENRGPLHGTEMRTASGG